ncbi:neighbor of COX4-like protein [Cricetulus griseus]|nr:neighbor of COX4-like protein [Cricetulus griseus]
MVPRSTAGSRKPRPHSNQSFVKYYLCSEDKFKVVSRMFEEKIDSWCKENNYVIAGYYQANERVKDASPNQVAEKVASRIAEGFSDTALIMVDNAKFTMDCAAPTIHVYEHHENRWRCRDPHYDYCEDWPEAQRISASLLDSRSYETLVDFDNHLDDIRNDWTNPEINKAVLHLC